MPSCRSSPFMLPSNFFLIVLPLVGFCWSVNGFCFCFVGFCFVLVLSGLRKGSRSRSPLPPPSLHLNKARPKPMSAYHVPPSIWLGQAQNKNPLPFLTQTSPLCNPLPCPAQTSSSLFPSCCGRPKPMAVFFLQLLHCLAQTRSSLPPYHCAFWV